MNLVLVDANLGVDTLALLLGHELLDLVNLLVPEQAVRVAERKGCRDGKTFEVSRDGHERRVTAVDGVHAHTLGTTEVLVSSENGISATPAEANRTDLVGSGNQANLLDEALDQGASDALAVLKEPRAKSCASLCSSSGLLSNAARVALGLLRLDGLQELNVKRITLVNVGDVSGEALCGVLVGEQAGVLELPAEDFD